MSVDHYTYRVTWSQEDNEYVGLCTEFPSLSWLAPKPEAALTGIRKVVISVVSDLKRNGEDIPGHSQRNLTAANSRCASRHRSIAHWHCKRPRRA